MIWWVLGASVLGLCAGGIWFAPQWSRAMGTGQKVEAELPCAFGYRMAWVAVRTRDTARLINMLDLGDVRSVGWSDGIAAVYSDRGGLDRVFVTPPVDGWSFVVSLGLPLPMGDAYVDSASRLLERLSDVFGRVAYFVSYPGLDFFGWALADDGRLVRCFAIGREGAVWNRGAVTADERTLAAEFFGLTEVGRPTSGIGLAESVDGPDPAPLHPFREKDVVALARAWTVDPTALDERGDLDRGIGYVGVVPRAWRAGLRVEAAA